MSALEGTSPPGGAPVPASPEAWGGAARLRSPVISLRDAMEQQAQVLLPSQPVVPVTREPPGLLLGAVFSLRLYFVGNGVGLGEKCSSCNGHAGDGPSLLVASQHGLSHGICDAAACKHSSFALVRAAAATGGRE